MIPRIVARAVSTQRTVSIRGDDKSTVAQSKIYSSTNLKKLRRFSERADQHNRVVNCARLTERYRTADRYLPRSAAASQLTRMLISFITRVGELAEASGDSTARPVGDSLTGSLRQAASRSGPIRGS